MKGKRKAFTENETISLMHEDTAAALRKIADYVEKWQLDWQHTVQLLREIADEKEAQAIVVDLRDII